jgi:hypothetical protein
MQPFAVRPDKNDWPLGQINSHLVVGNPADPDVVPTTFTVSLQGEHSEFLPGQVVAPGEYWFHGVTAPSLGWIENLGPSTLQVYVDGPPQAPGLRPAEDLTRDAASGRTGGAG